MYKAIGITFIAIALVFSVQSTEARNGLTVSGFNANVQEFHSMALAYCRRHAADVLDTTDVFGGLGNTDNFRRACGTGLNGREVAYTPWRHFYWRNANTEGVADVMGVVRDLDRERRVFRLVIGLETRISRAHNKSEERRQMANATLFENLGSTWLPVWRFVDPATGNFHRPQGGPFAGFIDDVWRRHVTTGFANLVWSLKDARGPGFPN